MRKASINDAQLYAFNFEPNISAVAAANDEVVCPDGNEKSDGGFISGIVPARSKGLILATMGFSVMLHISVPIIRAIAICIPYLRVLFGIININEIMIHMRPPSPRLVITGMI